MAHHQYVGGLRVEILLEGNISGATILIGATVRSRHIDRGGRIFFFQNNPPTSPWSFLKSPPTSMSMSWLHGLHQWVWLHLIRSLVRINEKFLVKI